MSKNIEEVLVIGSAKKWVSSGDRITTSKNAGIVYLVTVKPDFIQFENDKGIKFKAENSLVDSLTGIQVWNINWTKKIAKINWVDLHGP